MFDYWKLKRKHNTLMLKCEELEETIKKLITNDAKRKKENQKLKKENKKLRKELRDGRSNRKIS